MGLILKIDEPLLFLSVHIHRHHDAAGVDLIGLLLILEFTLRFQFLHSQQGQIHEADKFIVPSFVQNLPVLQVFFVSIFYGFPVIALPELHMLQFRGEGGVAAVVGPVGVQHPDLRHGRISFLLPAEILLDVLEVTEGHGQIQGIIELFQLRFLHLCETLKGFHIFRLRKIHHQGLRLLQPGLPGIHRVDAVLLDGGQLAVIHLPLDDVGGGGTDDGLLILLQKLDALHRGVRSLVKLTGQVFHGEYPGTLLGRKIFSV